jgi:iron complex outermembrane receptor protein
VIDAGASFNRSRTLYARLNLLYRQTHSFVDYVSRHRVYVALALTWAINPNTQLTFLGRYQHDTDHLAFPLPARGTVIPNPNGEIPISRFVGEPSNPNPVAELSYHFGYQLTHRFNDSLSLYQNFRFSWYKNHWDKLLYLSFLGVDQRTLFRYPLSWREEWSNYVADTELLVRANTGRVQHDVVAGVEYYREPRKYSSESIDFGDTSAYMPLDVFNPVYGTPFSTLRPFIGGDTRTRYIGLYLQDWLQLTNRLSLTAGGRLDFVSDRDFSLRDSNDNHAFSPRLGATYRLAPGVALYANYSKSFLPQTGIVYDGSSNGAFADPEKADQWEFGVKPSLFSGRMVNTFSVYRLTRNNVLTLDPNHPNFFVTGTQRSKGVELETVLQPRESWNLILAYAFTDARVVTDTVIPSGTRTQNVPGHSTNLWTTYELPRGSLRGAGFRLRRPLLHEPVRRSTAHILHSRLWCDGRLDFLSPRAFGLAAKRIESG